MVTKVVQKGVAITASADNSIQMLFTNSGDMFGVNDRHPERILPTVLQIPANKKSLFYIAY